VNLKLVSEANPDIFPQTGTVFVEKSSYVGKKLARVRQTLIKTVFFALLFLVLALYTNMIMLAMFVVALNSAFLINLVRNYLDLMRVKDIDPLLRISDDGLSWWNEPQKTLNWSEIGIFVRKASKIYALPRSALFQQDRPHHVVMCIDTALLKVKRKDLLAYLENRLKAEHMKGAN
jgi:hypothetical protein